MAPTAAAPSNLQMRLIKVGTYPPDADPRLACMLPRLGDPSFTRWMQQHRDMVDEVHTYVLDQLQSMALDDYILSIDSQRLYENIARYMFQTW